MKAIYPGNPFECGAKTSKDVGPGTNRPLGFDLDGIFDLWMNVKSLWVSFVAYDAQGSDDNRIHAIEGVANRTQFSFSSPGKCYGSKYSIQMSSGSDTMSLAVDLAQTWRGQKDGLYYPLMAFRATVGRFVGQPLVFVASSGIPTIMHPDSTLPVYTTTRDGKGWTAGLTILKDLTYALTMTPPSGKVGQLVTVAGGQSRIITRQSVIFTFDDLRMVRFDGVPVKFSVSADRTTVSAKVPPGAKTGPMEFLTSGGDYFFTRADFRVLQ